MSGSVDFSQMARSWALVPRPGVLLQHVVTLPPAGCCSQPLTRTLERQGTYPCTRRRRGVRFACGWPGHTWLSGCLVRIPSFVSTASSYPHPPAVPQSVGKGSLPELRSHLLPSPPLVFLLPPTEPGSRFNLPLFPSFLAVSRARRTQPAPASPGSCPVQLSPSTQARSPLRPLNEASCWHLQLTLVAAA